MRSSLMLVLFGSAVAFGGPAAKPTARIDSMEISKESAMYWRVRLALDNPATTSCHVTGYKLIEGTWSVEVKDDLTLQAGEKRTRSFKIGLAPDDGLASGRVEVVASCP